MNQSQQPLSAMLKGILDGTQQPAWKRVKIVTGKQVLMPSATYELTRDFAGTMGVAHDTFMSMMWEKLNSDLIGAMDAVIGHRTAQREEIEAEERLCQAQETRHHKEQLARMLVDSMCGSQPALVL